MLHVFVLEWLLIVETYLKWKSNRKHTCAYEEFWILIITYKVNKQQVLLYGTQNYIWYPVRNHNGKEYYKKEYVYMYIIESPSCTEEISTTL